MQSAFFRAICQMGIFIICAQTIVHFRPKESYEKYLKLLVSVMLLLQIFIPVTKLFSAEAGQNMKESMVWLQENLEKSMQEAAESTLRSEQLLEEMSLQEVERRIALEEMEENEGENGMIRVAPIGKISVGDDR